MKIRGLSARSLSIWRGWVAAPALMAVLVFGFASVAQAFETIARAAMVVDQKTGTVLLSKNADQPVPPASMSKLMTLNMLFEALQDGRINLDTPFTVSKKASAKERAAEKKAAAADRRAAAEERRAAATDGDADKPRADKRYGKHGEHPGNAYGLSKKGKGKAVGLNQVFDRLDYLFQNACLSQFSLKHFKIITEFGAGIY